MQCKYLQPPCTAALQSHTLLHAHGIACGKHFSSRSHCAWSKAFRSKQNEAGWGGLLKCVCCRLTQS